MSKKNNFEQFLSSPAGQKFFNVFYSWGAAVVIIGAMLKIIHFQYANQILAVGMITEALVFFVSGFDNSSLKDERITENVSDDNIVVRNSVSGNTGSGNNIPVTTSTTPSVAATGKPHSGGATSVVIVGGGVNGGNVNQGHSAQAQTSSPSGINTGNAGGNSTVSPEYAQSLAGTAQNLEEFSTTIQSLNEVSQKMLDAYKQVTETHGFVDNITTLNQNVSGLNEVFSSQLQTITEQMAAIRYINDSLTRMKNLYDGAIGDSYMFREESAKMTKHIEALNNVYARLLQAMTNNNNMNSNGF